MKSPSTGLVPYSVACPWNGTTTNTHATSAYQVTLTKDQQKKCQKPARPQHYPHKHIPFTFGASQQPTPNDTSPPLSPAEIKHVQDILGTLLYYAWAVDPTLAAGLSYITAQQAKCTQVVQQACNQLLDCVATHPQTSLKFIASDMTLAVHTDALYLSESNSKSPATGHFSLPHHNNPSTPNVPILTLSTIIWHILASASEAELTALFYGCKQAIPLWIT